jgi:DNA (cytosine-5)-methyltransferase 1
MNTAPSSEQEEGTTPDSPGDEATAFIPTVPVEQAKLVRFSQILSECYAAGEAALAVRSLDPQKAVLGDELFAQVFSLAKVKHAARGIALTLVAYKLIEPSQDIRFHKSEYDGGFSARSIDNAGTIPFLQAHSLYYNVETHWLSQTFSFAGPYMPDLVLKTLPKAAGPLMLAVVNAVQTAQNPPAIARAVLEILFAVLIDDRNRGKVPLEKPQNLSIDQTIALLNAHFLHGYDKNSPRLPQLAMYAIYQCTMPAMDRYKGLALMPLERMKAANRKSGSVGDVDVNKGDQPFEAVEIKFQIGIAREHVAEAIQKIKTASVQRYLILSTSGVADGEIDAIVKLTDNFRRSNGCEIIVNGVLETIKYYLRLIESPSTFINRYTALVESDEDLGYEHRLAWNAVCASRKA